VKTINRTRLAEQDALKHILFTYWSVFKCPHQFNTEIKYIDCICCYPQINEINAKECSEFISKSITL